MAMPSEKLQFPATGGEIHRQQQQQWFPDERDEFISWLRGEFAAANAIIDSLCQHLRTVGDPGEYDTVIGCIHQRRFNWTPVLHMQQYFPVAEVVYSLQQVGWKKQQQQQHQQRHFVVDQGKMGGGKEFRRPVGLGFKQNHQGKEGQNSMKEDHRGNERSCQEAKPDENVAGKVVVEDKDLSLVTEDKRGSGTNAGGKPYADGSLKNSGKVEVAAAGKEDTQAAEAKQKSTSNLKDNELASEQNQNEKQNPTSMPKTFVATEIYDGKTVNVVDGLKLYNELFDGKEVPKLVSLVNNLRVSGKRGQLQGQTYMVYKRPMKGRGREMIQLGIPIADAPAEDEISTSMPKDRRVDSIPVFLQDVIERLVGMEIMSVKPDACIIDFYNEGDHSQPHMYPPWFGRPVSLLSLSDCDLTFGRVVVSDHPGDFKGSLKLSLTPGSLLVMQGKSTDLSRHAIHSIRKQRILITFTKSQPKKSIASDGQRLNSSALAPPSHWGPPTNRPPNHIRHPSGPQKHYAGISTSGVLPTPPLRPQIPPLNGIQPLFVTAPVAPAMPFPAPVPIPPGSTGWPAPPPPRHPPPRIPLPGTGVFLPPPGSGNPSAPEVGSIQDKENGTGRTDQGNSPSPKCKLGEKMPQEECNGRMDECNGGKEEENVVGK